MPNALSKEQQTALFEKHRGLIYLMIKRFPGDDRDDLFQEGWFALVNAARLFNPNRGFKFTSYATRAIYRQLINARRDERKVRNRFFPTSFREEKPSKQDTGPHGDGGFEANHEPMARAVPEWIESHEVWEIAREKLEPKDFAIVHLRCLGKRFKEIAAELDISLTTVKTRWEISILRLQSMLRIAKLPRKTRK